MDYSSGSEASLPVNDDNLEYIFDWDDYNAVAEIDQVYTTQCATDEYALFEFKVQNDNSTDGITIDWTGQSDVAPSDSTVYLQVYNRDSTVWETIDSDGTTAADTDFDLQGTVTTSLSDYYDAGHWIACRVYQEVK